ncbi:MAG: hypothetical protein DI635_13715, partial [Pseudoxanthomonas suwonensis]
VWAVRQSDPVYLQLLLDHGGDPDTRNSNGETLFFQARVSGDQWQNIQLLVERGADINALTFTYPIAWNYSSGGGFGRVYWLLQHGADPKAGAHGNPLRYPIIDDIFWHPGGPQVEKWQRLCQQWLLQHGYQRTPMPEHYRKMRLTFGYPHEEKDIPLLCRAIPPAWPAPPNCRRCITIGRWQVCAGTCTSRPRVWASPIPAGRGPAKIRNSWLPLPSNWASMVKR